MLRAGVTLLPGRRHRLAVIARQRTVTATAQNQYVLCRPEHAASTKMNLCRQLLFSPANQIATIEGNMIHSWLSMLFGCSHKRTTFPLTPSRNSKLSAEARRGTYIVCLNCGKEFDYDWKEMRIGSPVGQLPATPSALPTRANSRTLNADGEQVRGEGLWMRPPPSSRGRLEIASGRRKRVWSG